ncbi:8-oxo-dGTP pyrophosphatase MutT, NUDIX family [Paraoerskovia marina]|uniref:8-oxo-dGTP pyrophosphatase MutT, NUDIX family n=1 Tax=Paraoerskovia marina TaxID=545619 RepID=A0A1H1NQZ6_9CELL|nr:NUDIX domain-containing protein [Paraoerskovia marina]SDS01378.1 8-oxo-dGTP pyrophosphatase MutT, NUDIX family [Paraoerskovia marina]
MTRAAAFHADLRAWEPRSPEQAALRDRYLDFLDIHGEDSLRRDGGPEHVTGSCFVLTPDLTHVLLCYHRKGQFWVQVGGHVEADDASVADGALREAREESGLDVAAWRTRPADLHRHELGSAFGRCTAHWDVGYVSFAPRDMVPAVSDESDDVAWFAVDDLPAEVPPDFPQRLATVLDEVRPHL